METILPSRLISKVTQSHLPRIITLRMYQSMTIRNWNTTTKLMNMMEAGPGTADDERQIS